LMVPKVKTLRSAQLNSIVTRKVRKS
jgi:hypothetical protein